MTTISSDRLISLNNDEYSALRTVATESKLKSNPAYACPKCGHGLYAPISGSTQRPLWKHFNGAPRDCPWFTGDTNSPDDVSRQQFSGSQESPLHYRLKHFIGEALKWDPDISNVVVDKYIIDENGRRRPDISGTLGDRHFVIEIQLAHTQLPIILQREAFYSSRGTYLIWMTWDFEPTPIDDVNRSIRDMYFCQSQNLFSLDSASVNNSKDTRKLSFKAYQEEDGSWQDKLITLQDLSWPKSGLPFFFVPKNKWRAGFINSWKEAPDRTQKHHDIRMQLLQVAIDNLRLKTTPQELYQQDVP